MSLFPKRARAAKVLILCFFNIPWTVWGESHSDFLWTLAVFWRWVMERPGTPAPVSAFTVVAWFEQGILQPRPSHQIMKELWVTCCRAVRVTLRMAHIALGVTGQQLMCDRERWHFAPMYQSLVRLSKVWGCLTALRLSMVTLEVFKAGGWMPLCALPLPWPSLVPHGGEGRQDGAAVCFVWQQTVC